MKYIVRQFGRIIFVKEVGEDVTFTTDRKTALEFDELEANNVVLLLRIDHKLEFIIEPK